MPSTLERLVSWFLVGADVRSHPFSLWRLGLQNPESRSKLQVEGSGYVRGLSQAAHQLLVSYYLHLL